MDRIKVSYSISDYPKDWSLEPHLWEMWIVGKLKEAGVPVKGKLRFSGIKSGTLFSLDDPKDFGKATYIWES